jgi:hypothetical protein
MSVFGDTPCFSPVLDRLHARFLALLPRIELHARTSFRHVKRPERKEDCIQEAAASPGSGSSAWPGGPRTRATS